ncbi:MAG: RNA polymerase sigma factor [Chloroflexi bacterium]|nr:RNA polymerase sigma factor [Chloroflexota bacterium]
MTFSHSPGSKLETDDAGLLARLRRRDEAAFAELVDRYHGQMVRVAMSFVRDRQVAEEVVQDAWLGLLKGLDRFEGRSSIRTWLFAILTNVARTRGRRENRSVSLSSLAPGPDEDPSSVDPSRFFPSGHDHAGHWTSVPNDWEAVPEERLLSAETRACIDSAIASLPEMQRAAIELRDVLGWSAGDVCNTLQITETNQRVLLHRARSKVRRSLEAYLAAGE